MNGGIGGLLNFCVLCMLVVFSPFCKIINTV